MLDRQTQRLLEGARRYAAADKSDPFALNRACAHIRSGIAIESDGGSSYEATETRVVAKLPDGLAFSNGSNEYYVTEYHSVRRV